MRFRKTFWNMFHIETCLDPFQTGFYIPAVHRKLKMGQTLTEGFFLIFPSPCQPMWITEDTLIGTLYLRILLFVCLKTKYNILLKRYWIIGHFRFKGSWHLRDTIFSFLHDKTQIIVVCLTSEVFFLRTRGNVRLMRRNRVSVITQEGTW